MQFAQKQKEGFMFASSVKRSKIALRAREGQYVCAEDGGGGEVNVTRTERSYWETFELIELSQPNKVYLRSFDGHYLCAESGGGGVVVANRSIPHEWETFELEKKGMSNGNVKVSLQASNGQYLCAEEGGGHELRANRSWCRSAEQFELVTLGGIITVRIDEKPLDEALAKRIKDGPFYSCTSAVSDVIWPGSIVDAASILTEDYCPIILPKGTKRAPLALSDNIPGSSQDLTMDHPSLQNFRQILSNLITNKHTNIKAEPDYFEKIISTEEQLALALGGHYGNRRFEIAADINFSKSSEKSTLVIGVKNTYFQIDVPLTFQKEIYSSVSMRSATTKSSSRLSSMATGPHSLCSLPRNCRSC
jgi:hypothetical protein